MLVQRLCRMLPRRMLWGAVVRQVAPRLTYSTAAQPQVGLPSHRGPHRPTGLLSHTGKERVDTEQVTAISKRLLTEIFAFKELYMMNYIACVHSVY